ncbi:uncharacterized protein [Panulirus ornatus]|uniref:uncharacterized protein n=1 Tax=Panulirus ornatus TaxID=150431 RepID=UPI003A8BADC7
MSSPAQEPRPSLLQTVYRSSLLTLATLMADHVDQLGQVAHLRHLDLDNISRVALHKPKMMYGEPGPLDTRDTDGRINGDAVETDDPQLESGKVSAVITIKDRITNENDAMFTEDNESELLGLILPSAPIFSFDEDGDILRRVSLFAPSVARSCDTLSNDTSRHYDDNNDYNDDKRNDTTRTVADAQETTPQTTGQVDVEDLWRNTDQSFVKKEEDGGACITVASSHQLITSLVELESLPNIDDTAEEVTTPGVKTMVEINKVPEGAGVAATKVVPRIDFHAASIEVVDDYLEDNLEENQLRDLCSTILGDTAGWQGSRYGSSQTRVRGFLSTVSQETSCSRRQRVPFHTVVFAERKPSTGDALVQSLGLSADGANTIQDIASKNQGAARERLQQGEVVPSEPRLTRHCESCGVSPEDCLKKLGLHTDDVRSVTPSPKSERLLQFFQNIQTRPPRPHRSQTPYVSDPELDQLHQSASRPHHSRSLTSSPTQADHDDGKPHQGLSTV